MTTNKSNSKQTNEKAVEKKLTQIIQAKSKVKTRDDEPKLFEQIANLQDIDDINTKIGSLNFTGKYAISEDTTVTGALCNLADVLDTTSGKLVNLGDFIGNVDSYDATAWEGYIPNIRAFLDNTAPSSIIEAINTLDSMIGDTLYSGLEYVTNATSVGEAITALDMAIFNSDASIQAIDQFINRDNGINVARWESGENPTTVTEALDVLDANMTDVDAKVRNIIPALGMYASYDMEEPSEDWTAVTQADVSISNVAGAIKVAFDRINASTAAGQITLQARATAESGYFATYDLFQGGTGAENIRGTINIPKDFLVKSAELKTVTTAGQPVSGYVVGDKYIDFTINTVDASETAQHIYLNVKDLVDVYTAQASAAQVQVAIDANNVISASIVAGSVGTTELANNAVTTAKILDANVTTAKIADANVTTAKIADSNVTTVKIADSNVTTAKIADDAVTSAKIADGAVGTAAIAIEDEDVPGDVYTVTIKNGRLIIRKIASAPQP